MTAPVIMWFRQDLRLRDNPAVHAALKAKAPILFLYILDDETPGAWRRGGASRWWLRHSLAALAGDLEARGAKLTLRRGKAARVVEQLAEEVGAQGVFWNRCYEPFAIKRDTNLKEKLKAKDVDAQSFNGAQLIEPWEIETKSGGPFKVFTPFWKAARGHTHPVITYQVPKQMPVHEGVVSDQLKDWALLPTKPDWATGFAQDWTPGEAGARKRLEVFLAEGLAGYANGRDRPDQEFVSRLSPHLHFGEISPRQIVTAAEGHGTDGPREKFFSELGWREFSTHLLYHFPHLPEENFRPEFNAFPWAGKPDHLRAWQMGETGIPMVDAGMRQLWQTGWMHNRVRMIVASFLTKHLLHDWREGAAWFWDTLVDADLGNNSASWQWVAGCGADAAPYFRIFNPVLQGEKFDPKGAYVRRWIPELTNVPDKFVHKPWDAPEPPANYPQPIIDLAEGRARALAAYEDMRNA